jgi:hypothetical protein
VNASRPKLIAFALLTLLLLCASGCRRMARVAECRRLETRVNGALDEISRAQDAGNADSATYRGLADRYDKLARDVDGFAKTDDAYGRSVKEYGGFLQETAATLRLLAEAHDRHDLVSIMKVRRDLGNFVRRDKTAVAHIDTACATP